MQHIGTITVKGLSGDVFRNFLEGRCSEAFFEDSFHAFCDGISDTDLAQESEGIGLESISGACWHLPGLTSDQDIVRKLPRLFSLRQGLAFVAGIAAGLVGDDGSLLHIKDQVHIVHLENEKILRFTYRRFRRKWAIDVCKSGDFWAEGVKVLSPAFDAVVR